MVVIQKLITGEYRVIFDRVYPCEPTKNHSIKCNLYFSKKTSSITELKGNITSMIPLDDTLTLDVNVASWSLTGGWKPNSIVYITKNACTNMKNVLGNVWYSLIKAFNGPITSCPLPAGTYITSGVDLKELEDYNAPKVYFYGKYKLLMKIKITGKKYLKISLLLLKLYIEIFFFYI
ncbi:hypothetical protein AGLY_012326 [Aphis glycines]|uniref:MD-2-related lipid-recognition domain-containing protein n=1 Tax=Aphis glycines TaxID=307491 RepID=A0A6G0TB32_APHGL|nr:hypothetical protein AGLY_012326 [Aphis glycines]